MKEWYIARGKNKYGPYTTEEMILLRQQRKAFEYDLVWKQGLRQWKPLIQTEEFSAHAMAERAQKAETCTVFNRRQWPRVRKEVPLIVHNEINLWRARTLNISQGGALIELHTPTLKPGDAIHVHFQISMVSAIPDNRRDPSSFKGFSCSGVIAGKRFSHERMRFNSSIQYSIRFEEMDEGASEQIAIWVNEILNQKVNSPREGVKNVATNR